MIGWLRRRRQARRERDAEQRLRRLIFNVADRTTDFYIPAGWVAILGEQRVNRVLSEYGLPPARAEGRRAA